MAGKVNKEKRVVRFSAAEQGNSDGKAAVGRRDKRKSGDKVTSVPAKKAKKLVVKKMGTVEEAVVSASSQEGAGPTKSAPKFNCPPFPRVPITLVRNGRKVVVFRVVNPVWVSGLFVRSTLGLPESKERTILEGNVLDQDQESDCMSVADFDTEQDAICSFNDDDSTSGSSSDSLEQSMDMEGEMGELDVETPSNIWANLQELASCASLEPTLQSIAEPEISSVKSTPPLEQKAPRRSGRVRKCRVLD